MNYTQIGGIVLISIIMQQAFTSCTKQDSVNNALALYHDSQFCKSKTFLSAYIWPNGMRMVAHRTEKYYFTFERILGFKRLIKNDNCNEDEVWHLVDELNRLDLLSIETTPKYALFYSKLEDSTYAELKNNNRSYFDLLVEDFPVSKTEGKHYMLVFVYAKGIEDIPDNIKRIRKINKIKNNWYYFRTYRGSDINVF
ncbi:hypothetical protein IC235_12710 [Hymenobacter sp. BT664]|uniref:Uncharacterized protein n=2 Tax=Hymenobacter montanus TaxID=2771359 RepID=A0A927BEZ7_9BACT|nr:hypothetical protein [Hymenobacter montanus]